MMLGLAEFVAELADLFGYKLLSDKLMSKCWMSWQMVHIVIKEKLIPIPHYM